MKGQEGSLSSLKGLLALHFMEFILFFIVCFVWLHSESLRKMIFWYLAI
jgi:hypothetical protein